MYHKPKQSGFALVESILCVGLIVAFIAIFVTVSVFVEDQAFTVTQRTEGMLLLSEGLDAVRSIRNTDFALLADGTHGLTVDQGVWTFFGTQESIGDFHRTITIESLSAEEKRVTSVVSWSGRTEHALSLSTILTAWK